MMDSRMNILLVDDDPGFVRLMAHVLAADGERRCAADGASALRLAQEREPDLMVLDAEMPGMSGFQLCEALRSEPGLSRVPVIFVSSHCDRDFELAAFRSGADDFIAKPLDVETFRARVQMRLRWKRQFDGLRRLTDHDEATALLNRRGFNDCVAREWRRAQRNGTPTSLLSIGIDRMNRFIAVAGSARVESFLGEVAALLTGLAARPGDRVGRVGTDRLSMLLPQTPRAGAFHVAGEVMRAFEALCRELTPAASDQPLSISIGVAYFDSDSAHWPPATTAQAVARTPIDEHQLVRCGELALRAAVAAGRSLVRCMDVGDADAGACIVPAAGAADPAQLQLALRPLGSQPKRIEARLGMEDSLHPASGGQCQPSEIGGLLQRASP